jgi:hypothetical protein
VNPLASFHGHRPGAAIGAEVAVCGWFAVTSCAAAGSLEPSLTSREVESMTIPPDLEAQIMRFYHVEKWRIGTIARQLGVPNTKARSGGRDRPGLGRLCVSDF